MEKTATPDALEGDNREMKIGKLVEQSTSTKWTEFGTKWIERNCISTFHYKKIEEVKNKTFKSYLSSLSLTDHTNYSLWKITKRMKRPCVHEPTIKIKKYVTWARSEQDKTEV